MICLIKGDVRTSFTELYSRPCALKDNFLCPRRLTFTANNIYKEALKDYLIRSEKEEYNNCDSLQM